MITPTYEQQWQKITEAYMRDEIKPYDPTFCFCGTLCDNTDKWSFYKDGKAIHCQIGQYTGDNFIDMEFALLNTIHKECKTVGVYYQSCGIGVVRNHVNYENAIFIGMTAALEVLRQIHEAKGDPTAKTITLQKRQLV